MNKLLPLIVLSCLLPLAVNARTITATGDTLDNAESKIRQQAAREGATAYRIIEAEWATKCILRRHSTTEPPLPGSGRSRRHPARQVRRSFFPVDDRGPAAHRTGERIPG
ncbi:Uncharacterised protein [Klebsiella quasipneumoniae]|nr:Uncharacterised protein [Klebsiella quasipneumoniae]